MKTIAISDEVYAALQELAVGFHRTPDEVLTALLHLPGASPHAADPLAAFIVSPGFRAKVSDADRYLALLGWVAERHPADFGEFIRTLEGGRRYLGLTREEIQEHCRHNQARPIAGTPYWAIMNLDTATKRRFLSRLLEYAGYRDFVIEFACAAIGMKRAGVRRGGVRVVA